MPFSSTMEKQTVSEPEGCGIGPSSGRRRLRSMRATRPSITRVIEQVAERHVGRVGIGDKTIAHGIGQACRLHQHVIALDRHAVATRPKRSSIFSRIRATTP